MLQGTCLPRSLPLSQEGLQELPPTSLRLGVPARLLACTGWELACFLAAGAARLVPQASLAPPAALAASDLSRLSPRRMSLSPRFRQL